MRLVVGIAALLAAVGFSTAGRVAGRIVILEKDNKPSPDLSDAVLYLESPAAVTTARPVTQFRLIGHFGRSIGIDP